MTKLTIIDPETLSEAHFQDLRGKRYILHTGLLRLAHEHGPVNIDTTIVSYAGVGAEAVVTATVSGPRGTFTDVGDASPENTKLRTATLRLASTRAINRACRLYLGLGMTSLEEMPPEGADDVPVRSTPRRLSSPSSEPKAGGGFKQGAVHYLKSEDEVVTECPECGDEMWDNRSKRDGGWNGPVFKCKERDCGCIYWPPKAPRKAPPAPDQGVDAADALDMVF